MSKAVRQTRTLAGHNVFNDDLLRALHNDTVTCEKLERQRE